MPDPQPNPLQRQIGWLRSQIQVAETVQSITESILGSMRNVVASASGKGIEITARSQLTSTYGTCHREVSGVCLRLKQLQQLCEAAIEKGVEHTEVQALLATMQTEIDVGFAASLGQLTTPAQMNDFVTGVAISTIQMLQNVGPHLVKSIEWLQKLNADVLGMYCSQIAAAVQCIPQLPVSAS